MTISIQTNVSVAASTNGMGAALTSSGASYVLTATGAADGLAHTITIKNNSATNHSGKTFAIVGTDENGNPLSQTITGPAGTSTVTSTAFFKTVATITPSASTGADTFDMGWTVNSVAPWYRVNLKHNLPMNIGIGSTVASGSPTYALQYTYDNSAWLTHATITGKTASFDGAVTTPCLALRIAFAAAGGVTTTYVQHDNR